MPYVCTSIANSKDLSKFQALCTVEVNQRIHQIGQLFCSLKYSMHLPDLVQMWVLVCSFSLWCSLVSFNLFGWYSLLVRSPSDYSPVCQAARPKIWNIVFSHFLTFKWLYLNCIDIFALLWSDCDLRTDCTRLTLSCLSYTLYIWEVPYMGQSPQDENLGLQTSFFWSHKQWLVTKIWV